MAIFLEEKTVDDWLVLTPTGYKNFCGVGKTIEYVIWDLYTENYYLSCADDHILIKVDGDVYSEIFVKDIIPGDYILIVDGGDIQKELVMVCEESNQSDNMYDLLDVEDGLYVTNNIVSHNSTTTICYALWTVLFKPHQNLAILANKRDMAMELLGRLQLAYENLPMWLQQGIVEWNKSHIELENGSKVIASSTSATSVRGSSYNCVFCDEFAFVPNGIQEQFMTSVYPTISSSKDSKLIITSCVTKDTYILTPNGYVQMKDFILDELETKSYFVPEYSVAGRNDFHTGNVIVNNGKQQIRKIYTKLGQTNCTLNHKFLACRNGEYGWWESSQLSVGDCIATKYNTQIFGDDDSVDSILFSTVTPDLAYFVGIVAGGGHITDDRFITITIRESNSGVFTEDSYHTVLENLNIDFDFDGRHYVIDSKELVHIIRQFKYYNPNKYENFDNGLTNKTMRWSKPNIIALLQGLFDSMALFNFRRSWAVKGDVYIFSINEDLVEQIHLLLLNLGILSYLRTPVWERGRYRYHIERKMRYTPRSLVHISNDRVYQFYELVGFRMPHKQQWERLYIDYRNKRKRLDNIPHMITFLQKYLTQEQKAKIFVSKRLLGNNLIAKNLSRASMVKKKDVLISFEIPEVTKFVEEYVHPDIYWNPITKIIDGRSDYVYDFSLPEIPNDKWCHSVLYNGMVGHQTPSGLNLFYKIYTEAKLGKNQYIPMEITWDMIPGRDEEFKRNTIANTSERQWKQEFESSSSSSIVCIEDLEGVRKEITLGELYDLLSQQNVLEENVIDIDSEMVD